MEIWPIVSTLFFLMVTIINKKTRLLRVIIEQFKIYKDDRSGKYYWLDLFSFIVMPAIIACIIAHNLELNEIVSNAGTIITVFSLIATLPLSFLALLIDKILQNEKKEEVAKETFISITLDIIYSMIVICIIIVAALSTIPNYIQKIIVGIISFLVLKIALNIMMILKRVFSIMVN